MEEESSRWCRRTYDEHRELVHSEMYRADGSLLCRDFPVVVDGEQKRYQQFYRPDGTPSVLAGATWDAYYLWLDALVGDGAAFGLHVDWIGGLRFCLDLYFRRGEVESSCIHTLLLQLLRQH